jgi:hypothetical protein
MTQPQGFMSKLYPANFVCRLRKSLYGLKQAPRAWNERFTSFFYHVWGFKHLLSIPLCLFSILLLVL